jgi:hypothetical protein
MLARMIRKDQHWGILKFLFGLVRFSDHARSVSDERPLFFVMSSKIVKNQIEIRHTVHNVAICWNIRVCGRRPQQLAIDN